MLLVPLLFMIFAIGIVLFILPSGLKRLRLMDRLRLLLFLLAIKVINKLSIFLLIQSKGHFLGGVEVC